MSMWTRCFAVLAVMVAGLGSASRAEELPRDFAKPPASARPWVYWFWINGNITKEGITADLEAMQRVGIGGVLIMEVDQGVPVGPVDFMGGPWRTLFHHAVSEARRLGLEINMNNDAGWNGSGGPWITPEESMQELVWTETPVKGPSKVDQTLEAPRQVAGFYRDITVLAYPDPGPGRFPGFEAKALFQTRPASDGEARQAIDPSRIVDLSRQMDPAGKLVWNVPAGDWIVVRLGHTSTGMQNAPAPLTGRGLECDKLAPSGMTAQFERMMARLVANSAADVGSALAATHIDSWENGNQNWTSRMRDEFQKLRGYDMTPYLPAMTGRIVGSPAVTERFLWDLRKTVSDLVLENYSAKMRDLAHAHGLRYTVEAYGGPCDFLPYAGRSDEPMGEFWMGGGTIESCRGMASAGHVYGKSIIGAESFTAADQEKWREHPGSIKTLGDQAFCEGINRFVFHRYAMQPWKSGVVPGMTMGPWGLHYERTQTWWETSKPWHEYLARCQHMLRQGRFVADLCYVQSETSPQGFTRHDRQGYDFDDCPPELVLSAMTVQDGRVTLPGGMSYRVLVLPESRQMTPTLLKRVGELVEAGATVIGPAPTASPSLVGYPACDDEVKQLAQAIWGDCDGQNVTLRAHGKGRIGWNLDPIALLANDGLAPDFQSQPRMNWIHRSTEDREIYFVANPSLQAVEVAASFRVSGRVPELWKPETGQVEPASMWEADGPVTRVAFRLEASESVFVVFGQPTTNERGSVVSLAKDGKPVAATALAKGRPVRVIEAHYGVPGDAARTRDVREPLQRLVDSGRTDLRVADLAATGGDPALNVIKTLTARYAVGDRELTVQGQDPDTVRLSDEAQTLHIVRARYGLLEDPARTRDVRETLQKLLDAGLARFAVTRMAQAGDPAPLVVKTLEIEFQRDGKTETLRLTDSDTVDLTAAGQPAQRIASVRQSGETPVLRAWEAGHYEVTRADGSMRTVEVPAFESAHPIEGAWTLAFTAGPGAPADVRLDRLVSWPDHPDADVKHFSGTGVYRRTFECPADLAASADQPVVLDLGRVEVQARVKLNGKDLGLLWKAPYRVDVTGALKAGSNKLEVEVTNLWINRLIGDESISDDSPRNDNGTLRAWPEWLAHTTTSPTGRHTFTTWRLWKAADPLVPSGLLGPVVLRTCRDMPIP
jgi:hypothetical protein